MFRMKWQGQQVEARMRVAATDGLLEGAEHILEESNRIVPLLNGDLMRSGETSIDVTEMTAAIAYGDSVTSAYARRQHEDTRLRHPNGRKAKFLETTLNERGAAVLEFIRKKIQQSL